MTNEMGERPTARRGLVVARAAALIVVLTAASTLAQAAGVATHTTLATESQSVGGRAVATYSATVLSEDGSPASGIVTLVEKDRSLASAALDRGGNAEIRYDGLAGGDHFLRAVYSGDSNHTISQSEAVPVHSDAVTGAPSFNLTISPTSLPTLAPGASGNVTVTITSVNQFAGFLSLSCAGAPVSPGSSTDNAMPVGVSCTFTPANVQVTSTIAASNNPTVVSSLIVQTTGPTGPNAQNHSPLQDRTAGSTKVLAVVLPGILGLGFLGRKRKLFGRMALLLMVGVVSVLGTTSCAARYRYLNHGPPYNEGTPAGSYTLTIWAQTSNGVTASEQFTTLGLTVN